MEYMVKRSQSCSKTGRDIQNVNKRNFNIMDVLFNFSYKTSYFHNLVELKYIQS